MTRIFIDIRYENNKDNLIRRYGNNNNSIRCYENNIGSSISN